MSKIAIPRYPDEAFRGCRAKLRTSYVEKLPKEPATCFSTYGVIEYATESKVSIHWKHADYSQSYKYSAVEILGRDAQFPRV